MIEEHPSQDLRSISCPLCCQILSYDPNDNSKEEQKNENKDWLFERIHASMFFPAVKKLFAAHQSQCLGALGHCMFCKEEFNLDQMSKHVFECPKNQFKVNTDYRLLLISDLNYDDIESYEEFIKYGRDSDGDEFGYGMDEDWDNLDSDELEEREEQELEKERNLKLPENVEKRRAEHPPPKLTATYWIHVLVPASLTLKELDAFLRTIWFDEPCGHLSKFSICREDGDFLRGEVYPKGLKLDEYGGLKNSNAVSKCVSKRLLYEFDFGSSSTVFVDSIPFPKEKIVKSQKETPGKKIILLSRNEDSVQFCQHCLFELKIPFSELSFKNVATMSISNADIGLCFSCYTSFSEKAKENPREIKKKHFCGSPMQMLADYKAAKPEDYSSRIDSFPTFIQDNITISNRDTRGLTEIINFNSPRSGMCGYCEDYDQLSPFPKFQRLYSNLLVYARTLIQSLDIFHVEIITIILYHLCPQYSKAVIFQKDLFRFLEWALNRKTIGQTKEEFFQFLGLVVPDDIKAKEDEFNEHQNRMQEEMWKRLETIRTQRAENL
jgi:hypothetical protein